MSTHTKGKWEVLGRALHNCHVGGFYLVRPHNVAPVAYVADRDDARLIASAPEMYAALKQINSICDPFSDPADAANEAMAIAGTLLARIDGGAQ